MVHTDTCNIPAGPSNELDAVGEYWKKPYSRPTPPPDLVPEDDEDD